MANAVPEIKKYRILDTQDSYMWVTISAKNIYSIQGKRKYIEKSVNGEYILPEYIEDLKSLSYKEREQQFGDAKYTLSQGDSVIFSDEDLSKTDFVGFLTPIPEHTVRCPISQWEVEEIQPTNPQNKAFNSIRAGGIYEIEPDALECLPGMILSDLNSAVSDFSHKTGISCMYLGSPDNVAIGITFHSKLTEEQQREFDETIYNKYLLKIKIFAWIAKQNLIKKEPALITRNILEQIEKDPSMPNYETCKDLLLSFLARANDGDGDEKTHIASIDELMSKSKTLYIDFSRPDIMALLHCATYRKGVRSILVNLKAQGLIETLLIEVDKSNTGRNTQLSQDPSEKDDSRSNLQRMVSGHDITARSMSLSRAPKIIPIELTTTGEQRAHSIMYNRNVFIAMSFHKSMNSIYEHGIKRAIETTGYEPRRVDKIPHINPIHEKIDKEIEQARFVVADFSQIERDGDMQDAPGGIYYEVGYAKALGKPIIWTCKKSSQNSIHFDIKQYKFILWDNETDLCKELTDTIQTVIIDI